MIFSLLSEMKVVDANFTNFSPTLEQISPTFINWEEIAVAIASEFNGYLCILLVDSSEECKNIQSFIHTNWEKIDILTGNNLLLFVPTFAPPEYISKLQTNHSAKKIINIEYLNSVLSWNNLLGIENNDIFEIGNRISNLYAKNFFVNLKMPSLIALNFEYDDRIRDSAFIYGRSFTLPKIENSDQLISMLKGIGELASAASKNFTNEYRKFCRSIAYNPIKGIGFKYTINKIKDFFTSLSKFKNNLDSIN